VQVAPCVLIISDKNLAATSRHVAYSGALLTLEIATAVMPRLLEAARFYASSINGTTQCVPSRRLGLDENSRVGSQVKGPRSRTRLEEISERVGYEKQRLRVYARQLSRNNYN